MSQPQHLQEVRQNSSGETVSKMAELGHTKWQCCKIFLSCT